MTDAPEWIWRLAYTVVCVGTLAILLLTNPIYLILQNFGDYRVASTLIVALVGAALAATAWLFWIVKFPTLLQSTVAVSHIPITDDLRLSITKSKYDERLGIVTIDLAFMNNGTTQRQILGYDFMLQQYEQPQHQPGREEQRVFESHSADAPLKIPARDIQAATYKQNLPLSDLLSNMTEYINL